MATISLVLLLVCVPTARAQSSYKTLHQFTGGKNGAYLLTGLIFDSAGNLYGSTFQGGTYFGTIFKLTPNPEGSWTESTLFTLKDGFTFGGLIFDAAGNLYGTTYEGGSHGYGVVFRLAPNRDKTWTWSELYSFCSLTNCDDGAGPRAGLIFDLAGNLYGTTFYGGIHGAGVVFKLTPSQDGKWTESVLYAFTGPDGMSPAASLLFDAAGNLYGTTVQGGSSGNCGGFLGCGVVFELKPTSNAGWKEKVLHRFKGGKDGFAPFTGLILDVAGNLYGTTNEGGNDTCGIYSCGIVFQLAPNASGNWKETVLHHFTGGADGGYPYAGVISGKSGDLYGTTILGGDFNGCDCGVAFRLAPNSNGGWKETVLHAFHNRPGNEAWGGLIFDQAGKKLYGTTFGDKNTTFGSVFEIEP